jgi:nitroreductase
MTKDVIEAILERRSIREYNDDPIPTATIGRIIEAAQHAPSAGNCQPWSFYVVFNQDIRDIMADTAQQDFVRQAPVSIVVCAVPSLSEAKFGELGASLYCIQDTAAAIQNMLLAAEGYGLGSCWLGQFDEATLRQALTLPEIEKPVAIVTVGYSDVEGEKPAYRPTDEFVHILN